jgi:2'-5' RNA ligase
VSRTIGVAVGIPEPWATELQSWRAKVGDPLAAYVPAHVTLLPPTQIEGSAADVHRHLSRVAARSVPFELHLRGTGTFRPVSDVVFVAVASGISECELLESDVRAGPLARPVPFPYHPHVTVAHDLSADRLDAAYEGLVDFEARFPVEGFTLFEHGADGMWRPRKDFPFLRARTGQAAQRRGRTA